MVTALGIDVRTAFTLVFAIGGVAAALAGVLSNVYFGTVDPARGTSLLIFAFIVVVIGGLGSIRGTARRRGRRRPRPAVRELLRLVRARRPLRRPAARARPARRGPAASRGASREARTGPLVAVAVFVVLAFVPKLDVDIPVLFKDTLDSPGTLQLLALCLVFAGVALTYDLLFGFTGLLSFGHALYFAVGVYLAAIAMTKWDWGFWTAVALHGRRRARAAARARRRLAARRRDRVRDGDARVRAGRRRARVQEPGRLDGRRGGLRRRLHEAARRPSSGSSTRRTCTGSRSATRSSSSSSCAGRSTRRRGTSGRRSARTSCASRCSGCARTSSS